MDQSSCFHNILCFLNFGLFFAKKKKKFLSYRQSYRKSLQKEKEEMAKSLETLQEETAESLHKEIMYKNYFDNIIKNSFHAKMQSKK